MLGIAAVSGLWPTLTFVMLPVMLIAGAPAFGFGLVGIHHALRGIGHLWMAVTGTVLGAIGSAYPFVLFPVLPFVF
ncbi:hypothetical protein [Streptomyces sp. IMTB 2501]|uniref:hypothetical protein n=1 Tax=Streptomyces sp. IMTB 2501 TaxID=1776340 RepID=UPI000D1B6274|nr:hypothetical protein [Streptomyces sp. IMTB 2501]